MNAQQKSIAATRLARLDASAKRWTTKLRRAETALRKITRQRAALARRERTQNGAER